MPIEDINPLYEFKIGSLVSFYALINVTILSPPPTLVQHDTSLSLSFYLSIYLSISFTVLFLTSIKAIFYFFLSFFFFFLCFFLCVFVWISFCLSLFLFCRFLMTYYMGFARLVFVNQVTVEKGSKNKKWRERRIKKERKKERKKGAKW